MHVEDRSGGEADAEKIKRKSIKKPSGWNSFYQSVASEVTEQLRAEANIGQVSKVASKMWRTLPSERRMDWKEKAQKHREDLDMGVLEDMKCPTCKTVFKRRKDFKYHIKDCQECECDFPGCGKLFNHKKKLERHKDKFHLQCFKCEVCSKVFAEKRNLKRHKCTHN